MTAITSIAPADRIAHILNHCRTLAVVGLSFALGEGPKFAHVVRDEAAVAKLEVPDMNKLRYVFDAVTSIRKALHGRVPLIGFSGSPWTLACWWCKTIA